jgi:hypothetical protein
MEGLLSALLLLVFSGFLSRAISELAPQFVRLANSLTLKMEVVCSSETALNFYQATLRHIP